MTPRLIVTLLGAGFMFAQPAFAQETGSAGGTIAACKTDVETLCKDAGQGRERFKCLRDNESKVSVGCKSAMEAHRSAREAMRAACKSDRETLCKDAGDERGAGMKCLRDNAAKVSSDCGKALAALPQRGDN